MATLHRAERPIYEISYGSVKIERVDHILKAGSWNFDECKKPPSSTGTVVKVEREASPGIAGKENTPRRDVKPVLRRRSSSKLRTSVIILPQLRVLRRDGPRMKRGTLAKYVRSSVRAYSLQRKAERGTCDHLDDSLNLPPSLLALSRESTSNRLGSCSLPVVNFQRRSLVCPQYSEEALREARESAFERRSLHSTKTWVRMESFKDGGDSDDETDPQWMVECSLRKMDEFLDVNKGEGAMMKMWTLHKMKYNIVSASMMPVSMDLFVREWGPRIICHNLRKNFGALCSLLLEQQLISQSTMLKAHVYLNSLRSRGTAFDPPDSAVLSIMNSRLKD